MDASADAIGTVAIDDGGVWYDEANVTEQNDPLSRSAWRKWQNVYARELQRQLASDQRRRLCRVRKLRHVRASVLLARNAKRKAREAAKLAAARAAVRGMPARPKRWLLYGGLVAAADAWRRGLDWHMVGMVAGMALLEGALLVQLEGAILPVASRDTSLKWEKRVFAFLAIFFAYSTLEQLLFEAFYAVSVDCAPGLDSCSAGGVGLLVGESQLLIVGRARLLSLPLGLGEAALAALRRLSGAGRLLQEWRLGVVLVPLLLFFGPRLYRAMLGRADTRRGGDGKN